MFQLIQVVEMEVLLLVPVSWVMCCEFVVVNNPYLNHDRPHNSFSMILPKPHSDHYTILISI